MKIVVFFFSATPGTLRARSRPGGFAILPLQKLGKSNFPMIATSVPVQVHSFSCYVASVSITVRGRYAVAVVVHGAKIREKPKGNN